MLSGAESEGEQLSAEAAAQLIAETFSLARSYMTGNKVK